MSVPNGTPGAGDAGLPAVEAEAIDGATGDPFAIAQAAFEAQPLADETPEDDASTEELVAADSAEDVDTTATDEDDADLAQYPEAVREKFKALEPVERKALLEHAEANAREGMQAVKAREDAIAAATAAREAVRAEIREKLGRFLGKESIVKVDRDGNERIYPSLDEAIQLNVNPRSRQQAYEKYGLDEHELSAHIEEMTERNRMLDSSAEDFDDRAWFKLDQNLQDGIRKKGLDPAAILSNAKNPADVISQLVDHVSAGYETKLAEQKAEYEGRITARDLNAEGLRGRAVAASSRVLAAGGRSAGGSNGKVTTQQLIDEAGSPEEFAIRAARGDYKGLNLRD